MWLTGHDGSSKSAEAAMNRRHRERVAKNNALDEYYSKYIASLSEKNSETWTINPRRDAEYGNGNYGLPNSFYEAFQRALEQTAIKKLVWKGPVDNDIFYEALIKNRAIKELEIDISIHGEIVRRLDLDSFCRIILNNSHIETIKFYGSFNRKDRASNKEIPVSNTEAKVYLENALGHLSSCKKCIWAGIFYNWELTCGVKRNSSLFFQDSSKASPSPSYDNNGSQEHRKQGGHC